MERSDLLRVTKIHQVQRQFEANTNKHGPRQIVTGTAGTEQKPDRRRNEKNGSKFVKERGHNCNRNVVNSGREAIGAHIILRQLSISLKLFEPSSPVL